MWATGWTVCSNMHAGGCCHEDSLCLARMASFLSGKWHAVVTSVTIHLSDLRSSVHAGHPPIIADLRGLESALHALSTLVIPWLVGLK